MNNLTITIPTIDRPKCLQRYLDSIAMCYPTVSVLVGDSSATPYALEMVKDYENVRAIRLPTNCGVGYARTALVNEVATQYSCVSEDDMLVAPGNLEPLMREIERGEADLAGGGCLVGNHKMSYDGTMEIVSKEMVIKQSGILPTKPTKVDCVTNWFVAPTPLLIKIGWDEALTTQEHEDFFWRAKLANVNTYYVPDTYIEHAHMDEGGYDRKHRYGHERVLPIYTYLSKKWDIDKITFRTERTGGHNNFSIDLLTGRYVF